MNETNLNGAGTSGSTSSGSGTPASAANGGGAGRSTSGSAGGSAVSSTTPSDTRTDAGAPTMTDKTGDADAGAVPADLPIDFSSADLAKDLAQAVCGALRACLGDQKLTAFVGRESCEARFEANLAQQDFATLEQSAKRGHVKVTRDALAQCYSDTRALGCKIQTERLPESCQRAIAGQSDAGEACSIGADCSGDTFCPITACPRKCSARAAAAGGSCTRDEECVNGLICLSDKCRAPAGVGEACAGTTGAVCALGTSCVGSSKTQAGKCMANSEVQSGAEGQACTPGGILCKEGLSCAFDGGDGFSCQAAAESGGACHLALPGQCPNDEYCTAEDVMAQGSCHKLPVEGAACVLGGECAGGHVCLAGSDGKGVCWKLRDLGESCTKDATCRSGRCAAGKCAAPTTCE